MATAVYLLCAVASAGCAGLLFWTSWNHRGRVRPLVFWTALCFTGFAISNGLVVIDLIVLRNGALATARAATACLASAVLLFGLIWDAS
ncbi:MAG TPA: DUF5985 family protein [Vicinamibacterales bacterium]|jgi:hypothetical protein